jgi:hypothetical protein
MIVRAAVWFEAPLPVLEAVTVTTLFISVAFGEGLAAWLPHEVNPIAKAREAMMPKTPKPPTGDFRRGRMLKIIPKRGTSNAQFRKFVDEIGPRNVALAAVVPTVSVLEAALPPLGVTDDGLKLHIAPEGRSLHAKVTAELNPFMGVTVNLAVPLCPATMVRVVGETDRL